MYYVDNQIIIYNTITNEWKQVSMFSSNSTRCKLNYSRMVMMFNLLQVELQQDGNDVQLVASWTTAGW